MSENNSETRALVPRRTPRILNCLVRGLSIRETAREVGVSERTVDRRLRDPRFVQRYEAAQARILDAVLGKLITGAVKASDELESLLADGSPLVRVAASRAILEYALKMLNSQKLAKQLSEAHSYIEKTKEKNHAYDGSR